MSDHYFTADPSVPFIRERFECEVWGERLALTSGSGVYSRGRLDGVAKVGTERGDLRFDDNSSSRKKKQWKK